MRVLSAVTGGILLALAFPLTIAPIPMLSPWVDLVLPQPFWSEIDGFSQAWPLAFVALIPLLEAARKARRPREAFILGYIGGLVWLLLHWMWLSSFGALPVVLLSAFFALPTGLFCFLAHWMMHSDRGQQNPAYALWGTALIWTAIEYIRSFGFWAWPWNLLGYSQVDNLALLQIADLGGVYAVTFAIALCNGALFVLLTPSWNFRPRLGHSLLAASLLLACLAYGHLRLSHFNALPDTRQVRLALVQGGMETLERWSQSLLDEAIAMYVPPTEKLVDEWQEEVRGLENERRGSFGPHQPLKLLVIWPETSMPASRGIDPRHPENLPPQVQSLVRHKPATMLIGTMGRPQHDRRAENGCLVFDSDGMMDWAYSKIRLVPYGEVVPLRKAVEFLPFPWGSYDVSEGKRLLPYSWNGVNIGLGVCFDNVFGFISREETRQGADLLVLVTNNSWYKLNSGVRQHCDIDILRAVENRRPLARVSTTGWSHVIGADGRILESTLVDSPGTISRWVSLNHETSVYTLVGDLFAQLCLLLAGAICIVVFYTGRNEGFL